MDIKSFISAIDQICEEKGIAREKVMETIEMALAAAYKKEYNRKGQNIKIKFDPKTGKIKAFQVKQVVDESMLKPEGEDEGEEPEEQPQEPVKEGEEEEEEKKIRFNPERHIMLDEANKLTAKDGVPKKKVGKLETGDEIEFPLEVVGDFGRIAAQTAKQVIIQRIREAERESVYDEYKDKEGRVVSGIVQRVERGSIYMDIGKTTGVIFPEEQVSKEYYRIGQRMKVYIIEVQKDSHGSNILLSRAHPQMISELFALEVPEISAGTVEIKGVAREAGSRSKIAVTSTEERVDPIGSMIGQKGTRVQAVINELGGEKIDIVEWSDDPGEYISQALSPAKVLGVEADTNKKEAKVVVPADQLSLAIGVKGQNVRLAAKLTGWKIDISAQDGAKAEQKEEGKKKKKKAEKAGKEEKKEKKKTKKKAVKKEKDEPKKKTAKKKTVKKSSGKEESAKKPKKKKIAKKK